MPRLLTLQAARGVAANLVVIAHLYSAGFNWTAGSVLPAFSFYGVAGVDLFFVLSGFIMVAVAGRNVTALQFLYRRAARIYPTYWLVSLLVLCSLATHALVHSSGLALPASIWRSFLLIPQPSLPLLAVGWTLVFEAYFYLVFTIFLALRIPVSVGLLTWAVIICSLKLGASDQLSNSPVFHVVTNPLTVEFVVGAVIGVLWQRCFLPGRFIVGTIGVISAVLSIGYFAPALSLATNPHLDAWRVVLFGIPAALLLYALVGTELQKNRLPLRPLLVKLGDWSYATYLMHPLVILVIGKALFLLAPRGGIGPSIILAVTGIIAANLAGAVVHVCFERPTLKWLHNVGMAGSVAKTAPHRAIAFPGRPSIIKDSKTARSAN